MTFEIAFDKIATHPLVGQKQSIFLGVLGLGADLQDASYDVTVTESLLPGSADGGGLAQAPALLVDGDTRTVSLTAGVYSFFQVSVNCTEIISVDALCPIQFWSAKCLKWPIVTRAHVPRHRSSRARRTS
jgi:hypothetical protein